MSEPAKSVAPKAPSVIRIVHGTEESEHDRLMRKYVPAFGASTVAHALLVGGLILLSWSLKREASPVSDERIQAVVDAQPDDEKAKDLTNPDLGLDDTLRAAVPEAELKDVTVDTKITPDEPPGVASDNNTPIDVPSLAGMGNTPELGVEGINGDVMRGAGGNNGAFIAPGFRGRNAATREKMAMAGGGNAESEAAVARGLAWLATQQRANGSWVYDGSSAADTCASTAMALLPFLAAGQTHKAGVKGNTYQAVVKKGLDYLLSLQKNPGGDFRTSSNMYSHAIAAVALCELYGMTGDKNVLYPAKLAIEYIVKAQGPNGSWGYRSGQDGDTSIVGWQIQALKSAEMCKDIPVPKATMEKAIKFLDYVAKGQYKEQFGYRDNDNAAPATSLTAVGLLCRYYTGWGPLNLGFKEGSEALVKRAPPTNDPARFNMYYYYYATQVMHFYGGDAWKNDWNPKMRDLLVKKQVPQDKPQKIKGSWDPDRATIGGHCGRLGTTCMALLTLEVYYRHLPLYKRDDAGKVELER